MGSRGWPADGVELMLGPSSCHGIPLQAVWGRGKLARGLGLGGVSRFSSLPGARPRKRRRGFHAQAPADTQCEQTLPPTK